MNLGDNIKHARKKSGISQMKLAEILGVKQKDISRWENNSRTPNVITFGEICKALNVSADEVLEIK